MLGELTLARPAGGGWAYTGGGGWAYTGGCGWAYTGGGGWAYTRAATQAREGFCPRSAW